jgi:P-type conjugative transfer protein TrbG
MASLRLEVQPISPFGTNRTNRAGQMMSVDRNEGDNPPWRPVSAFDDGSKVYIEMPSGIAEGEAPPLFVVGPEGDGQLVNYRVRQNYYIVDRLFAAAELRMGGEHQQTVRISRTDGRAR